MGLVVVVVVIVVATVIVFATVIVAATVIYRVCRVVQCGCLQSVWVCDLQ